MQGIWMIIVKCLGLDENNRDKQLSNKEKEVLVKKLEKVYKSKDKKLEVGKLAVETARHHAILFWMVTTIFTTALGGLLLVLLRTDCLDSCAISLNFILPLSIFGLILTLLLIKFAASFRFLRQNEQAVARIYGEVILHEEHIGQWWPFLFIQWMLSSFFAGFFILNLDVSNVSSIGIRLIFIILAVVLLGEHIYRSGLKYETSCLFRQVKEAYGVVPTEETISDSDILPEGVVQKDIDRTVFRDCVLSIFGGILGGFVLLFSTQKSTDVNYTSLFIFTIISTFFLMIIMGVISWFMFGSKNEDFRESR